MAQGVGILTGVSLGRLSLDVWQCSRGPGVRKLRSSAYLEQSRNDVFGFGAWQTGGETWSP